MKKIAWVLLLILLILWSGCVAQNEAVSQTKSNIKITEDAPPQTPTVSEQPKTLVSEKTELSLESANADYVTLLSEKYATCISCHGDVKPFHTPEAVFLIDEKKGITPRLCMVCHGQKIHDIHWELLDDKHIICDTCHGYKGGFVKPKAVEGQLLVCEVCHSNGNYIKIHIEGKILEGAPIDNQWKKEGSTHQCDTCHVGDYDVLHSAPLELWRERINDVLEETITQKATPLNISYI